MRLSTAKMIEQIELGQVAKVVSPTDERYFGVQRTEDGLWWIKDEGSEPLHEAYMEVTDLIIREYKWELQHEEITFQEAYNLLRKGLQVTLVNDKGTHYHYDATNQYIAIEEAVNGRWFTGRV